MLLLAFAFLGANVEARPISITDLYSLAQLGSAVISPDGAHVAYVTTKGKESRLWIRPFDSSKSSLISSSKTDDFAPLLWSPDGKTLSFSDTIDGHGRIALWNAAKERITFLPRNLQGAVQWFPDSAHLLLKRVAEHTPAPAPSPTPGITVFVSPTQPPAKPKTTDDLVSFDVKTESIAPIARRFAADSYNLSPSGTKIAYVRTKGTVSGDPARTITDLYVIDTSTHKQQLVASDLLPGRTDGIVWSPDESKLAFIGGLLRGDAGVPQGKYDLNDIPGRCYVVDTRDGTVRSVGAQIFSRFWAKPQWSANGSAIYAILAGENGIAVTSLITGNTTLLSSLPAYPVVESAFIPSGPHQFAVVVQSRRGEELLYRVDDISGRAQIPFRGFNGIYPLSFSRDGKRTVYGKEDVAHPPDLWIADGSFKLSRQITNLNPQTDTWGLANREVTVKWHSRGSTIYGALLLPAGYQQGKRYPTLVEIYPGGLWTGWRNYFGMFGATTGNLFSNAQMYATRGYAVFTPDTGILRTGHPVADMAADYLAGIDKAVAMGIVDPQRLGLWGGSYGGYGTIAMVTQTHRFKAAVSYSGLSDLFTLYGEMSPEGNDFMEWAEHNQGRMGGTPWRYRNRYIENSPFFYLDRVQTPLLLEYGAQDPVIFPFNSRQTFVGLRRLGKPAMLVGYANASHGISDLPDQIDFFNRMLAWFNKYLKY